MGQASTVTIAGTEYDIYGTVAGAKSYFAARLGSEAYDSADSTTRNKSQVTATRWLDRTRWLGERTDPAQPLDFPRTGLTDCDGNAEPEDEVPDEIEQACYELMLVLLGDATSQDVSDTGSNTKRLKAGSVEIEYFKPTIGKGTRFPNIVNELVKCFLASSTTIIAPFVSGTDEGSSFDDEDAFNVNEGL